MVQVLPCAQSVFLVLNWCGYHKQFLSVFFFFFFYSISDFAVLYASKLGINQEVLKRTLWGDFYLNTKTKRIMKGAQVIIYYQLLIISSKEIQTMWFIAFQFLWAWTVLSCFNLYLYSVLYHNWYAREYKHLCTHCFFRLWLLFDIIKWSVTLVVSDWLKWSFWNVP